jgi:hypothetical protein
MMTTVVASAFRKKINVSFSTTGRRQALTTPVFGAERFDGGLSLFLSHLSTAI